MAARVGITTKTLRGDVGITMWTWMAVLMNTYYIALNKATKQTTDNPIGQPRETSMLETSRRAWSHKPGLANKKNLLRNPNHSSQKGLWTKRTLWTTRAQDTAAHGIETHRIRARSIEPHTVETQRIGAHSLGA